MVFGARTIFCWRALYFLQEIERCADALIDRAAFIFSEQHILSVYSTSVLGNRRLAIFRGPKNVLLARR